MRPGEAVESVVKLTVKTGPITSLPLMLDHDIEERTEPLEVSYFKSRLGGSTAHSTRPETVED
jgi:hypothetical protein